MPDAEPTTNGSHDLDRNGQPRPSKPRPALTHIRRFASWVPVLLGLFDFPACAPLLSLRIVARVVRTCERHGGEPLAALSARAQNLGGVVLHSLGWSVSRRLTLLIAVALCGISSVALAACGSSGSGTASAPAASSSAAPASSTPASSSTASGTPITLGASITESGSVAVGGGYSYSAAVANAWTKWVNANGGVNGHPVKMVVLDDAATPATEESNVRELVQQDHAVAVFVEDQSEGLVAPYLASQHVALFSGLTDGGHTQQTTSWFGVDIEPPYIPLDFALVNKDAGATKESNAVCSEVAACLAYGKQLAAFAPKIGMQSGVTTAIAETATSATAQCLAILGSHSDAINMFVGTNPIALISSACNSQGYKGFFNTASLVDATFNTVKVPILLTAQNFPWWVNAAPVVQYRQVMSKYGGGADYQSRIASNMWQLLQVFSYGMKAKGPAAHAPVTGSDVISAMQNGVKNVTLGGLLPQPITFSPTGSTVVRCFWPAEHKNGAYSLLQGSWPSGNGTAGELKSQCLPADAAG